MCVIAKSNRLQWVKGLEVTSAVELNLLADIDDIHNIIDGDACLGNVGGEYDLLHEETKE